jgi:hypothetical protein
VLHFLANNLLDRQNKASLAKNELDAAKQQQANLKDFQKF